MTNPELNGAVALILGWEYKTTLNSPTERVWVSPSYTEQAEPPRYCESWEFCAPLINRFNLTLLYDRVLIPVRKKSTIDYLMIVREDRSDQALRRDLCDAIVLGHSAKLVDTHRSLPRLTDGN